MKIPKRKHRVPEKCTYCGEVKEDAFPRINPYKSEIHGDDSLEILCQDCYYLIGQEI
jgi:hypothetical protein